MQAIIWLVLFVIFLIVESGTVALVSIWFAAGALVAMIVSFITPVIWIQAVVFLVVACALLAMLRPIVRKYFNPKLTKTNVDSVIGSTGLVTEAIDNITAQGRVKLGAMYWSARSASGEPIPEGTLIRVEKIEGVKVIVEPAEETVTK